MPMCKKNFLIFCVIIVVFSQANIFAFCNKVENSIVNISVMAGPSVYSVVGLDSSYLLSVLKSPNDAVARLMSGESDYAILPSFLCFNLLNKDEDIKIVAIVGSGNLSIISSDANFDINNSSNTIFIPSKGSTPDFIINYLYPNIRKDYSYIAPIQLASMLVEGKVSCAVLPEPYTTMVLGKNSNLSIIGNVQEAFKKKSGVDDYPISLLVTKNKKNLKQVLSDIELSVDFLYKNKDTSSDRIALYGFISKEDVYKTIDSSGVCFISGNDMIQECKKLYQIIRNFNPNEYKYENLNI